MLKIIYNIIRWVSQAHGISKLQNGIVITAILDVFNWMFCFSQDFAYPIKTETKHVPHAAC